MFPHTGLSAREERARPRFHVRFLVTAKKLSCPRPEWCLHRVFAACKHTFLGLKIKSTIEAGTSLFSAVFFL